MTIESVRGFATTRPNGVEGETAAFLQAFDREISEDLNTVSALSVLDIMLGRTDLVPSERLDALNRLDEVLGLQLATITRADLRVRPASATIEADAIEAKLVERKEARAAKDFTRSDAIRDELAAAGVEVMDGDPLGWDWKIV